MRILRVLLVAFVLTAFTTPATFAFQSVPQKKDDTSADQKKDKKTVKVKEYKKKDGTKVKAHTRKPPSPKGSKAAKPKSGKVKK